MVEGRRRRSAAAARARDWAPAVEHYGFFAFQAQRVEVAKRVSDTQAKIVESVVGTMLKDSKLSLDKAASADALVVVDEESRKQARDLLSGASGRPHWEANHCNYVRVDSIVSRVRSCAIQLDFG